MGVDWEQIEEDLNQLKQLPWETWKKIYEQKIILTLIALSGYLGNLHAKNTIDQGIAKDTIIAEIFLTLIFGIFAFAGLAIITTAISDVIDRYTT